MFFFLGEIPLHIYVDCSFIVMLLYALLWDYPHSVASYWRKARTRPASAWQAGNNGINIIICLDWYVFPLLFNSFILLLISMGYRGKASPSWKSSEKEEELKATRCLALWWIYWSNSYFVRWRSISLLFFFRSSAKRKEFFSSSQQKTMGNITSHEWAGIWVK